MLEKARYITIEGPIGVGKTSLAQRLARHLEAHCLLEEPDHNPFLAPFYQNIDRWALPIQLNFFLQRLDQLKRCQAHLTDNQRVINDFLLEKDTLFARLNLTQEEFTLYERIVTAMKPASLPQPDLVIYLQARADTLMERIRHRGVETERNITETYLERVVEHYTRFFYQYDAAPLFIVDTSTLNPVDHASDFELFLEHLSNMRGYREFFGYAE